MLNDTESFSPSRGINAWFLMLFAAGLGFCLWKTFYVGAHTQFDAWVYGWIGIPFTLFMVVNLARLLAWRGPSIVLDSRGVSIDLPSFSTGLILWSEIGDVQAINSRSGTLVRIQLKLRETFVKRFGLKMWTFVADLGSTPCITIPATAMNITTSELAQKIIDHRPIQ